MSKGLEVITEYGLDQTMYDIYHNTNPEQLETDDDCLKFCKTLDKLTYTLPNCLDDIHKSIITKRKIARMIGSLDKTVYTKLTKYIKSHYDDLKYWKPTRVPRNLLINPPVKDDGTDAFLEGAFYSLNNRFDTPLELFEELRKIYLHVTKHLIALVEKISPIHLTSMIYFGTEHYMNN